MVQFFLDIRNPWVTLDQIVIFVFQKSAKIRFLKKIPNFQSSDFLACKFGLVLCASGCNHSKSTNMGSFTPDQPAVGGSNGTL